MRTSKVEGIVLTRTNLGEADKLITLFTKQQGKKKVLAKGIRKLKSRRAPHLEPFSQVSLVLHTGKNFDLVTEAETIHSFAHIRKKLERVGFVYIALELVQRLTAEHQESYIVYRRLLEFLSQLNDSHVSRQSASNILVQFKRDLLSELGFAAHPETLTHEELDRLIEDTIERKLTSHELLTKIQHSL